MGTAMGHDELRVPTVPLAVVVTTDDGRSVAGQIFIPAAALRHAGPMRPEEWINEPALLFFPFLPEGSEAPLMLNKSHVAIMSLPTGSPEERASAEELCLERRVVVECGTRRLEGALRIEMPTHHSRVLDYLNQPEPFLVLCEGERHHLVQKRHITRVLEVRQG